MFTRQVVAAIRRMALLSAFSLMIPLTRDARAEVVILVLDLRIDTHNGERLPQPIVMNSVLATFDNTVTSTRESPPATTKLTYFESMQDVLSVPETPFTDDLLATNPGWPYELGNDAVGKQYYRVSGTTHPNLQSFTVGISGSANYTDPQQGTNWYWLYFRAFGVQESNVFNNEGDVGFFTSESLMAFLRRAMINGYPFSFGESSYLSNDLTDAAGSISEYYEGTATLKFIAAEEAPLDIKPGSCPNPINPAARGKIPVAIPGTSEFDVTSIDPNSLRLEGVPPLSYSYSDVTSPLGAGDASTGCDQCSQRGTDGYQDLVMHFDVSAIAERINSGGMKGCGVLVLTGERLDGTPFIAKDVIRIVH